MVLLANSSGNNNGWLACQTNSHVYPHIGATNTRLLRGTGGAKWTESDACRPSHAIDGRKPPQDNHLQFQDADVLGDLPGQNVHIGVLSVRDNLLQLPEPPPHHVLEWPPAHQRRHSFVLPHCEHGFPSHISAEANWLQTCGVYVCRRCLLYDTARGVSI